MTINLGAQSTSSILFCKSTSSDKGEIRQREIKRETKKEEEREEGETRRERHRSDNDIQEI